MRKVKYIVTLFCLLFMMCTPFIYNFLNNYFNYESKYVFLGGDSIGINISFKNKKDNEVTNEIQSGTLTYIDIDSKTFGAIAHSITNARKIRDINNPVYENNVIAIDKESAIGSKITVSNLSNYYGQALIDSKIGVFGTYNGQVTNRPLIQTASPREISKGNAFMYTVIDDVKIERFNVEILGINLFLNMKQIKFKITDKALLLKTNGVLRGMSGSPIVQNDKLIGAVSHVSAIKNNIGYAIFISDMLK